jgi:hypothetical protein
MELYLNSCNAGTSATGFDVGSKYQILSKFVEQVKDEICGEPARPLITQAYCVLGSPAEIS